MDFYYDFINLFVFVTLLKKIPHFGIAINSYPIMST